MSSSAATDRAQGSAAGLAGDLDQERQWLRAARVNPEQFCFFYDKYVSRLRGFIRRRLGDPELTEDMLALVFTKALTGLGSFRWRGVRLGAWLFSIAAHELSDHFARESRRFTVFTEHVPETAADPADSQLTGLIHREGRRRLRRCVQRLSVRDRDIFILHYWEGLKTREVAARLHMSENTVKTRLSRGRSRLRTWLAEPDA